MYRITALIALKVDLLSGFLFSGTFPVSYGWLPTFSIGVNILDSHLTSFQRRHIIQSHRQADIQGKLFVFEFIFLGFEYIFISKFEV